VGSLTLSGGVVTNGTIILNGDVTVEAATLPSTLANVSLGSSSRTFAVTNGATLEIRGIVSGTGGLIKTGPGPLRLSGTANNTYSGATEVRSGILELAKTNAFAIRNSNSLIIGNVTMFPALMLSAT